MSIPTAVFILRGRKDNNVSQDTDRDRADIKILKYLPHMVTYCKILKQLHKDTTFTHFYKVFINMIQTF